MKMPSASALRFPEYIRAFDIVPIQQVYPAKRGKIANRLRGPVCVARDIKPELEHDESTHGALISAPESPHRRRATLLAR